MSPLPYGLGPRNRLEVQISTAGDLLVCWLGQAQLEYVPRELDCAEQLRV